MRVTEKSTGHFGPSGREKGSFFTLDCIERRSPMGEMDKPTRKDRPSWQIGIIYWDGTKKVLVERKKKLEGKSTKFLVGKNEQKEAECYGFLVDCGERKSLKKEVEEWMEREGESFFTFPKIPYVGRKQWNLNECGFLWRNDADFCSQTGRIIVRKLCWILETEIVVETTF